MKRALMSAFVVALAACEERTPPPRGQLLLFIDTDAPLALAPGEAPSPEITRGLFDRVRVETLLGDLTPACAACARDFSVNRSDLASRTLSLGILASGRADLLVRVSLFRATAATNGRPREAATIERVFAIPAIPDEGVVEATAFLPVEMTGRGAGETIEALRDGPPGPPALHPSFDTSSCTTAGGDGQVCIRGLAFWMSDPRVAANSLTGEEFPERLVALSPFWMDEREVTVAELRAAGVATSRIPIRATDNPRCTYASTPGPTDGLPVNCARWEVADAYCRAKGGRLPTEAEQEALLGAREGHRYVWGEDDPTCEDLVFGRGLGTIPTTEKDDNVKTCALLGAGPQPAGAGRRDVIEIGGRRIVDLAGNLAEYSVDEATERKDPCRAPGFVKDPVCRTGTGLYVARGAAFNLQHVGAKCTVRAPFERETGVNEFIGFRCVRPGR